MRAARTRSTPRWRRKRSASSNSGSLSEHSRRCGPLSVRRERRLFLPINTASRPPLRRCHPVVPSPLYNPDFEHDACGVGFIAKTSGERTHDVIERAIAALKSLAHRGAIDADAVTGDGAGLLTQIPARAPARIPGEEEEAALPRERPRRGHDLPAPGRLRGLPLQEDRRAGGEGGGAGLPLLARGADGRHLPRAQGPRDQALHRPGPGRAQGRLLGRRVRAQALPRPEDRRAEVLRGRGRRVLYLLLLVPDRRLQGPA